MVKNGHLIALTCISFFNETGPYSPIFSGRKAKINLHTTPKLTEVIPISCLLPCADPGIFVRGGGGVHFNLIKKSSDSVVFFFVFFAFFLVLGLVYRSQMVNFKEKISFFKVPEGVQIFPGGSNFSRVGGGGPIAYSL